MLPIANAVGVFRFCLFGLQINEKSLKIIFFSGNYPYQKKSQTGNILGVSRIWKHWMLHAELKNSRSFITFTDVSNVVIKIFCASDMKEICHPNCTFPVGCRTLLWSRNMAGKISNICTSMCVHIITLNLQNMISKVRWKVRAQVTNSQPNTWFNEEKNLSYC